MTMPKTNMRAPRRIGLCLCRTRAWRDVLLCAFCAFCAATILPPAKSPAATPAPATNATAAPDASVILPTTRTVPKMSFKNVQWPYFSSTTGNPICRLNIGKVLPASKRTGPFTIPIPGYEIRQVVLDIIPGECTPEDWTTLAAILADMRRFTLREPITLRLLDESANNNTPAATWPVTAPPTLRASSSDSSSATLLFLSQDTANRRIPLLLYRDGATGSLVLQSPTLPHPPPRPTAPNSSAISQQTQQTTPLSHSYPQNHVTTNP